MPSLTDQVRRTIAGAFVRLSEGVTHYEIAGPESGPPVVLIHGFSVPAFIWDPTFAALAEAGFSVLRYDLFGRGYSDRPHGRYDLARFDRQLVELVATLELAPAVGLVGLSMGGAIAAGVADRHPTLVRSLALIDPAGLPLPSSSKLGLLRIPLLGEVVMATIGKHMLVSGLKNDFYRPGPMAEAMERFRDPYLAQMQYPGFLRALLSTIRYGPLGSMADAYARVGRQERRVLLIWGREDRTVPFALSERVRVLMPNADFHAIEGVGHVPHLERPDLVNPLLVGFLSPGLSGSQSPAPVPDHSSRRTHIDDLSLAAF
ncbi:MAG: alpha/beta fold hydrolase [Anaerolineae bacterium]|nr:alpha/beta fold hydrolase [Anaerolineae bacterium]